MRKPKSLYVIKSEAGPVKIGISANPEKRLATIIQCQPYGATIVHIRGVVDERPNEIEAAAHRILGAKQRRGEWFDVTVDEAVAAIDEAVKAIEDRRTILAPEGFRRTSGGRPATGQTPAIGVRLPAPVRTAAERSAARAGVSLSERIRIAIERDIAEHG